MPGYNVSDFDPAGRPWWSERYVPCDFVGWCNATNVFDCLQVKLSFAFCSNSIEIFLFANECDQGC